jgi:predicted dehydrogenase
MAGPRLGFVGVGWIGAMRLDALAAAGAAEVAALCDTSEARLDAVSAAHRSAHRFRDYASLLDHAADLGLDGVVIATPNALHAPQAVAALRQRLAVFCQKPLALDATRTARVLAEAKRADRLLAVDYSYRFTDAAAALGRLIAAGELGRVHHIDTVFHNAYGPDRPWCYDPAVSGGGALMDLGVHQIDLALWLLGFPTVLAVHGGASRRGVAAGAGTIDDFATARLNLADETTVHVAVSWHTHAGVDCVIRTAVHGTYGGAEMRNVEGSFYDFELVRFDGRHARLASRESKEWLGRGALDFARRLAASPAFDPAIETTTRVAAVVDALYARTPHAAHAVQLPA